MTTDPMLVDIMRRDPSGQVVHIPQLRPKTGTSTRGFLAEYHEALATAWAKGYIAGMNDEADGRSPDETRNPYGSLT